MAGGDDDGRTGSQGEPPVRHHRRRRLTLPEPHLEAGRRQNADRVLHELGAGEPGISADDDWHGGNSPISLDQVVGEASGGPYDNRPVHTIRPCLHRPPQPGGAEGEGPVHPFAQLVEVLGIYQPLEFRPGGGIGIGCNPGASTFHEVDHGEDTTATEERHSQASVT